MGKKTIATLIFLAVFSSLVSLTYAQEPDVNLLDLPQQVADYFGISEFAAKYLISGTGLLFVTIVVGFIMKKSANQAIFTAILVVNFVMMAFFVALGWIDYWVFLILCLLVALMLAGTVRDLITGK